MLALLFFSLLLCHSLSDCPLTHYPKRVTIGYIHAEINEDPALHSQKLSYPYPLVEPLLRNSFETVIGVAGLETWVEKQLSFQITVEKETANTVIFGVIVKHQQNKWKTVKFNFLVSESSYLHLGIVEVSQFMITPTPYTYRIIHPLKHKFKTSSQVIKEIFIVGVDAVEKQDEQLNYDIPGMIRKLQKLKDYSWNVEIINKLKKVLKDQSYPKMNILQKQIKNHLLSFNLKTSVKVVVRKFVFSYVIFEQYEKKYDHLIGSFIATDNYLHYYDSLKHNGMIIFGLSGLKYVHNSQFLLQIQSGINEATNQLFYHSIVKTIQNQYSVSYFGIQLFPGLQCTDCPSSSYIYENFCVSQCPVGYAIGRNQYSRYICQKCQLSKLLIPKDGKCVCAAGHYFVAPTQQCQVCPYDCLTCEGNKCLTCDSKQFETQRRLNTYGRCVCPETGYFDDVKNQDQICHKCHYSCLTCSGISEKDCISCNIGRIRFPNSKCFCDKNFAQNQYGNCICAYPNYINNGVCVHNSTSCNQNEVLVRDGNQKKCQCKEGMFKYKNKCIQCDLHQQFDYGLQKCVCNDKTLEIDGKCIPCKNNQIFNPVYKTCDCLLGYQKNNNGDCITCPPQTFYNPYTDECECIFNYYKAGKQCIRCTNTSTSASCHVVKYNQDPYYV